MFQWAPEVQQHAPGRAAGAQVGAVLSPAEPGVNPSASTNYVVKRRAESARRRQPESGKTLGKLPPSVPINAFWSPGSPQPFSITSSSASSTFCSPFPGSQRPLTIFRPAHATSFAVSPEKHSSVSPAVPQPLPSLPSRALTLGFH